MNLSEIINKFALIRLYKNTLLLVFLTLFFLQIPNKSNYPREYYIPLMVALIAKYCIGDLDETFKWSISDIFYWIYILIVPYITIFYINRNKKSNT
tara:strand:- start:1056 stop:1343 length:288 start_codon:yes stop_codon:yes gene_type:complete